VWDACRGQMITHLKQNVDDELLNLVFNEASKQPLHVLNSMLRIEAQIYGRVNLTVDVQQIAVAAATSKEIKDNIRTFCKNNKIKYLEITPDDPKIKDATTIAKGKSVDLSAAKY
jgi:hypothetical protein